MIKHDIYSEEIDRYMEQAKKAQPGILQEMLDSGVPITYRDETGRLVKEIPDGSIVLLKEKDSE